MESKRLLLAVGALLGAGVCLLPATAVAQRRAARVEISPTEAQVQVGGTTPFVATAYDNAGSPIATATFVFTTGNSRAATIDRETGIATGVGTGVAIITATTGSGRYARSAQATLQVTGEGARPQPQAAAPPAVARPPVTVGGRLVGPGCAAADREPPGSGPAVGLMVEPLRVTLVRGESKPLAYRPVQGSGDPADHVCVQFGIQPGGEKVAAVDSFGVVLAGSDTGHAVVQVMTPGKTFPPVHVAVEVRGDSVKWRAREISMVPGAVDTLQLVVPAQGNRPINSVGIFQFVSSDTTKVRVAGITPIVTALAAGTARVIAQSSVYPDIPLTIDVHRRVTHVVGTPVDTLITLAIGTQASITARPLAADSSVVNEVPLTWSVSDTTVARYDTATKALHGLKMGEIFVRVSAPVANDSVRVLSWRVKVIAGGLAVSRPGPKVALGVGEHLPVEVKLLDDKRQPIETANRLTWTTSNDSVARVTEGQLVAAGMGRARVTARSVWDSTATTDVTVVGDLLVYALRNGRWDIFMLDNATGTGQPPKVRQLTQDTMIKSAPVWSPTLTQIAYVATPGLSGNADLYLLDLENATGRRLTHDSAVVASPSFLGTTGDQIVFESSKNGKAQIYVMKLDGTGRRQVTTGDNPNTQPSGSPDGRKVLYTSVRDRNYDIYEIGLDGTPERRLTNSPRPEDSPQYAADGRTFYYLRDDGGNPASKRVYRQDLAPSAAAPGAQVAPAAPITPAGLYVRRFSVSPDGSTLALEILTPDANGVQTTAVVSFNVATGTRTPLVLPGADKIGGPARRPATPH